MTMEITDEIEALYQLVPIVDRSVFSLPGLRCPLIGRQPLILTRGSPGGVSLCQANNDIRAWDLRRLIIHLNDVHQWPRVDSDWEKRRRSVGEGPALPSIYWWLKTNSEAYGWDLTVKVQK